MGTFVKMTQVILMKYVGIGRNLLVLTKWSFNTTRNLASWELLPSNMIKIINAPENKILANYGNKTLLGIIPFKACKYGNERT